MTRQIWGRIRRITDVRPLCGARRALTGIRASTRPCIVVTSTQNYTDELIEFTGQIRHRLDCPAVALVPTVQSLTDQHDLSFDQELQLLPQDNASTYVVAGATAADCVLIAVDQKAGLLQAMGLSPVCVVILHRGPALSSDVDVHAAVAVARQAAVLGLPAIASCLATPSISASMQPVIQATIQLLQQVVHFLQSDRGSSSRCWPSASNFPRAHFPFPEAGRWSLGKELPLPRQTSNTTSTFAMLDCWALGDDSSWAGSSIAGAQKGRLSAAAAAADLVGRAFADGDVFLCVNVPPTWQPAGHSSHGAEAQFASTRPGVIWHCHQVESATEKAGQHSWQQQQHHHHHHLQRQDLNESYSWRQQPNDLYGRTLPSSSLNSGQGVQLGKFVGQDNTDHVIARVRQQSGPAYDAQHQETRASAAVPLQFTIRRGTMLNDQATAGDVEAVFSRRAAVTTLQTWPTSHPLSLRDDVLAAALDEGPAGLPAWLSEQHDGA